MKMNGLSSKFRGALLATALAVCSTALSATPAAAADGCTLTITRLVGPEFYDVTVSCTGGSVDYFKLYGSDEFFDDFIISSSGSTFYGLNGDFLNEDIGGRDEIYAKAYYTTPSGKQRGPVRTNMVYGHFGGIF